MIDPQNNLLNKSIEQNQDTFSGDTRIIEAGSTAPVLQSRGTLPEQFQKLAKELFYYSPLKNTVINEDLKNYFLSINNNYFTLGAKPISSVGGSAEVFKIPFFGQWYALKAVLSDIEIGRSKTHFQPKYAVEQILNEAMILDEIGYHKNIVNIHYYAWFSSDSGPFANRNFMLLDFLGGGDLSHKNIREKLQGQNRYKIILQIGYEMALVLNSLAPLGIIHRDIKPRNILWDDKKNKFVLLDFGLAIKYGKKLFGEDPPKAVIGTPAYMSPEQIKGENIDFRSDQYSLGGVLYELLSGKPPHRECHSSYEILTNVLYSKIDLEKELCKIEDLRLLVTTMTQKDPQKRIQDSNALVTIFKDLLKKYS